MLALTRSDPISHESLTAHIQGMNDRSSPQSPSSPLSMESSAASTSSLLSVPSNGHNPSHYPPEQIVTPPLQSPSAQASSVIVTTGNAVSSPPDRIPSVSHLELLANVDAVTPRISPHNSLRVASRRTEPIGQGARAGQQNRRSPSRQTAVAAYEARMKRYARMASLMHAQLREETRATISHQDAKEKLDELLEEWPFSASSALHQNTLPSILREYVGYIKAPSRCKGPKPQDQLALLILHVKTWMADQLIRGTLKVRPLE